MGREGVLVVGGLHLGAAGARQLDEVRLAIETGTQLDPLDARQLEPFAVTAGRGELAMEGSFKRTAARSGPKAFDPLGAGRLDLPHSPIEIVREPDLDHVADRYGIDDGFSHCVPSPSDRCQSPTRGVEFVRVLDAE